MLFGLLLVVGLTGLPADVRGFVRHVAALVLIAALAWLAVSLLYALDEVVAERYSIENADNLRARQISTRVEVFRRFGIAVISAITLAAMLMTFPAVQYLGTSLLASAGLIGVVLGVAAQRPIGNLIAGVQIALTQPIRLGDVVVIDGEWGWIEEIGTTHVVVRIWDLRRLVLPLSYILEKPFQNWTVETSNILGTVFIYADYTVPVAALREALHSILEASGMWDGRVWGLVVTDTTDRAVELRALMSAPSGPAAWDLRCHVREKLLDFLQTNYPQCLPRSRVLVDGSEEPDLAARAAWHGAETPSR
jgi:small-conductance mechanosensitive channel